MVVTTWSPAVGQSQLADSLSPALSASMHGGGGVGHGKVPWSLSGRKGPAIFASAPPPPDHLCPVAIDAGMSLQATLRGVPDVSLL